MTKYLTEERFIVQSNDKESIRRYAEGWERTFGEKSEDRAGDTGLNQVVDLIPPEASFPVGEERECDGYYDDGIMPTACRRNEGCGFTGCPYDPSDSDDNSPHT